MKLIERTEYLNQLINVQGTPDVKVITGIRRSGKSKLLEAFIDVVIENEPDSNVIHINYNDDEFEDLLEYHALLDYVKSKYVKEKNNYLLMKYSCVMVLRRQLIVFTHQKNIIYVIIRLNMQS